MGPSLHRLSLRARVTVISALLIGAILAVPQIAGAVVTDQVRTDLPVALDGEVWAVEQVGPIVVVGGNFTQVLTGEGGPTVDQASIFAYDLDTGTFIESFRPVLQKSDGEPVTVRDLVANADGTGVYVGGNFTTIDDGSDGVVRFRNRIALLDVRTGELDRTFSQGGVSAEVLSLDLDQWGRLYAGGAFLNAFEIAPGAPRVQHAVRGLARFDAITGEFDQGFRYESRVDIGKPVDRNDPTGLRLRGVGRVVLHPGGQSLFVSHRGAEIHDVVTGEIFDSPGIARIDIGANTHTGVAYKALAADPNDPTETFYSGRQCGNRGVQIRDLDVGEDYVVAVHQGADGGFSCDTAVRFPSSVGEHRPDWVARAFDSLLSVEIDGDDIYIGGHFRYLVNDTAPSPYPGDTTFSGDVRGNIYNADPDRDIDFVEDLVEPGFVFESFQIGVLDAATGFADPSFLPVANADFGVLELTAVERGLLLGQDEGRVNNQDTGRSAFFDNDPTAGLPQCSVTLGDGGAPSLSWTDVGGVASWTVVANGEVREAVLGSVTEFSDAEAALGESTSYELQYDRNDVPLTANCGSVTRSVPTLSCSARLVNGNAEVTWNDLGWDEVEVSANGSVVATVAGQPATYTETAAVGSTTYSARAFLPGSTFDADCSGEVVVVGGDVLACVATVDGDEVTLSWSANDANVQVVRRNGAWIATVPNNETSFTTRLGAGDHELVIRLFGGPDAGDITCDPNPVTIGEQDVEPLVCTAALIDGDLVLTWSDNDASTQVIRRGTTGDPLDAQWIATVRNDATSFTASNPDGNYFVRLFGGSQPGDIVCEP